MDQEFIGTIVCPHCGVEVSPDATLCPQCGCGLIVAGADASVDPQQNRLRDEPWFILVLLLHLGVLGIPFYLVTRYSLVVRLALVVASILYTLFVIAAVILVGAFLWRELGSL